MLISTPSADFSTFFNADIIRIHILTEIFVCVRVYVYLICASDFAIPQKTPAGPPVCLFYAWESKKLANIYSASHTHTHTHMHKHIRIQSEQTIFAKFKCGLCNKNNSESTFNSIWFRASSLVGDFLLRWLPEFLTPLDCSQILHFCFLQTVMCLYNKRADKKSRVNLSCSAALLSVSHSHLENWF